MISTTTPLGTLVTVPAYGKTYTGKITKIGRTRCFVTFTTIGGKVKCLPYPMVGYGAPIPR